MKKRTIKFLKNAKKGSSAGSNGGKGQSKSAPSMGKSSSKKPRLRKEDMLEDMEVEHVLPMRKHRDGRVSAAAAADDDDDEDDGDDDEDDGDLEGEEFGDDEDDDEVEDEGPSTKETKKKQTGDKHKDQLQQLADDDPEFFKYLQQNDASLLEFDEDESDGEEDEGGEDDDDDDGEEGSIPRRERVILVVTEEVLQETIDKAKEGSFAALKKMLSIFRAACLPSGADAAAGGDDEADDDKSNTSSFSIPSPEVYQQVIVGVTDHAHACLYQQLDLEELAQDQLSRMNKHPKWKKVQFLVMSFFKSMLHVLNGVSEASKQGQVASFLTSTLEAYLPLLTPLPRLSKAVLNTLLTLWASGPPPAEDEANVRAQAFLRIRQMALMLPGTVREECFRAIYLRFARACKSCTEANIGSVAFMAQSIAELYQSDPVQAYQQGFLYIRQLALHLRAALSKQTAEATRQVTTWQFLHCIRLWTRVVCSMPREDQLGPLVFPLAQVMFGVMAAGPSMYLVPLRLHLITSLHQLAAYAHVFIPTAARLTEILEHPDLSAPPTPSTETPPKLAYLVRLADDSLLKVTVRDVVVGEVMALLRHDAEVYRYHVGFPEYTYLTVRKLRAFAKKTKVSKWRDLSRTLAGQLDDYSAFAKQGRVKLGKAPMQIKDFEPLLPLAAQGGRTAPLPAVQRLVRLLADRAMSMPREVVVSAHQSGAGRGVQTGKRVREDEDDDDDEDDDGDDDEDEGDEKDDDEEEEEDDDEEEEEEDAGDANAVDRIGKFEWSDDDDDE